MSSASQIERIMAIANDIAARKVSHHDFRGGGLLVALVKSSPQTPQNCINY